MTASARPLGLSICVTWKALLVAFWSPDGSHAMTELKFITQSNPVSAHVRRGRVEGTCIACPSGCLPASAPERDSQLVSKEAGEVIGLVGGGGGMVVWFRPFKCP